MRKRVAPGAVDRLAVRLEPSTDPPQPVRAGRGNDASRVGADVEQVVDAAGGAVDQEADQGFHRLPVPVVRLEPPGVVQGAGRLPVSLDGPERLLVVAQAPVVAHLVADAAAHQAVGLQRAHQPLQPQALSPRNALRGVEPDQADGAVLREQLLHLGPALAAQVAVEVFPGRIGIVPGVAHGVRVVPVLRLRVVEAEPDPRLAAFAGQVGHGVAAEGRGIDDVVVAAGGVEQGEAVVVFGSDHDVLLARLLGQSHPGAGIEPRWVEPGGQSLVLRRRNPGPAHDPFGDAGIGLPFPPTAGQGVEPPMDEHPEPGRPPPLQCVMILGLSSAHGPIHTLLPSALH